MAAINVVQNTDTSTPILLDDAFDSLEVIPGVSVATPFDAAVSTNTGEVRISDEGSIYGRYGFQDTSGTGGDTIYVGQAGSLIAIDDAISIDNSVNGNFIDNLGSITSLADDAIAAGAHNTISNAGTISAGFAIDDAGADTIANSGRIFGQIQETAGGNSVSNSGTITGSITFAAGDDTLSNTGTIVGVVWSSGDDNSVSNNGTITGAVSFAAGDDTLSIAGTIAGPVSSPGGANTLSVSGALKGGVSLGGSGAGKTNSVTVSQGGLISGTASAAALEIGAGAYVITNDGEILEPAAASGATPDSIIVAGAGTIVNNGEIESSGAGTISNTDTKTGDVSILHNFGVISGAKDAIDDTGGHIDHIYNNGRIAAGVGYDAIVGDSVSDVYLDNAGVIAGAVNLGFAGTTIVNSGAIQGDVSLGAAGANATDSVTVSQGGAIDGAASAAALTIGAGGYDIKNDGEILEPANGSGAASDAIVVDGAGTIVNDGEIESSGAATISNTDANTGDVSILHNFGLISGADEAIEDTGGHTDEIFNNGRIAAGVGSDAILGASASDVYLVNAGVIAGGVNLGYAGTTIVNSGAIQGVTALQASGEITNAAGGVMNNIEFASAETQSKLINHGEIVGSVTSSGVGFALDNYGAIDGAVTLAGGGASFLNEGTVDGNLTFSGNDNVYKGADGSVSGDIYAAGADGTYIGGAEATTFVFSASVLGADDVVIGGSNNDTLLFSSAGSLTAFALKGVSGIETIDLANGTNSITLSNALVGSAHNATLRVNGGTGADTINASAVSTTTDTVIIDGGPGADFIDAGAAHDIFVYNAASDSAGAAYDTISGINFGHDTFDLGPALGTIPTIDAAVTSGTLSTTTFAANLTSDLPAAKLAAHSAVMFTASAGTLSGDTFLVVNPTATAGYQSSADLVMRVVGATGTLAAGNFS